MAERDAPKGRSKRKRDAADTAKRDAPESASGEAKRPRKRAQGAADRDPALRKSVQPRGDARAKSAAPASAPAGADALSVEDEVALERLDEANAAAATAPIDGRTLDEIRREVAEDKASEDDLLALAKGLQLEDEDEVEDELVLSKGPVFEGEVPLGTPEERLDAMQKAARRIGLARLYPEQEQVLDSILRGEDVLMVLPTGFGKSACYQIPSLIFQKPVLVISPLLALMKDQFDSMQRLGLPCIKLDSQLRGGARKAALEQIAAGDRLLVMTTPETLTAPDATAALAAGGVSLAAVDEAHCISEWGYDFRPAYLQIGERLRGLGAPPALALTATATEKVRLAITRFVGLREPRVVSASPHRDNLAFDVLQAGAGARLRALVRLALRVRRPGIIYCSTTRDVDEIYAVLQRFGVPSYRYHGKMSALERRKSQEGFMTRGRRTVMVATNAFGLGIDKPDIRYVMHYQSPASLEQYVQEAGRAGRDGRRANCIMLFSSQDRSIHEALLARSRVRPEQLYRLVTALSHWAKEDKVPTLAALALTADLGSRTSAALLALLEEGELVKWDPEAVHVLAPADEFVKRARALGGQFETLRSQDARRLDAVMDYALLESCRAAMLEEYFGEESSGDCGICDHCRGGSDRPSSFWEPLAPPRRDERQREANAKNGRGGRASRGRGDASKRRRANGADTGARGTRRDARGYERNERSARGRNNERDERGGRDARGGSGRSHNANGAYKTRDGERRGYASTRDGERRSDAGSRDNKRRSYAGNGRDGERRHQAGSERGGEQRRTGNPRDNERRRTGNGRDGERRSHDGNSRDGERRHTGRPRDNERRNYAGNGRDGERRGYDGGAGARDGERHSTTGARENPRGRSGRRRGGRRRPNADRNSRREDRPQP